jgi:hypothetical protein
MYRRAKKDMERAHHHAQIAAELRAKLDARQQPIRST